MGFNTVAWQILLDEDERPSFKTMLWARWIGESVKGLLPVAQALSLTKRVRTLLLGLPGLIDWQIAEGRRLRRLQNRQHVKPQILS
jgi:hypothetical protein